MVVGAKIKYPERDKRLYVIWYNMLYRCKNKNPNKFKTYLDCKVHEYFLKEKNFYEWWRKQIGSDKIGWELDKDILQKGNTIYGPDTCVIVPMEINMLVNVTKKKRSLPLGVHYSTRDEVFRAQIADGTSSKYLGSFHTVEEAFECFKKAKELRIKEVAEKWKEEIDPRVYEVLINWTIEVTD